MAADDQDLETPDTVTDPADAARLAAERAFARGVEMQRQGDLAEAGRAYGEAIGHQPGHLHALNNLALTLKARGLPAAAAACFRRALAFAPEDTAILGNLASLLRDEGDLAAAAAAQHRIVAVAPRSADAHLNLGLTLRDLGHLTEAAICFERALRLRPDQSQAPWELTVTYLTQGDYARGFRGLHERWQPRAPRHRIPTWQGEPLEGKRILVYNEQPFGDAILFARFAARLKAAGAAEVTLEIDRPLLRLFETLEGVDRILVPGDTPPAADYEVPLFSLPGLLGLGVEEIASEPYLTVPASERGRLTRPLGTRLSVGLCWSGRATHRSDRHRSTGLIPFLSLLSRPEVNFVSLQKGPTAGQVVEQGMEGLIQDLSGEIEDFADLAHWMRQVDLVVSVDTAVAHLAGALGRPCWVLLPFAADWRWGRGSESTPWYRRMHLFRQPAPGDWTTPFTLVGEALDQVLAAQPG